MGYGRSCPRLLPLTLILILLACECSIAKGRYTVDSFKKPAKKSSAGNDHAAAKSGRAAGNETVQESDYNWKTSGDEAADQVAKLMSKDYTVPDRLPKRNPPINNHQPTD